MSEIRGIKCTRYHLGSDGRGTCDTNCQWWHDGYACPFWVDEKEWETNKDRWNKGITIDEFAKEHNVEIIIDKTKNEVKPLPFDILILVEKSRRER